MDASSATRRPGTGFRPDHALAQSVGEERPRQRRGGVGEVAQRRGRTRAPPRWRAGRRRARRPRAGRGGRQQRRMVAGIASAGRRRVLPALTDAHDRAVVDEHAHELLHEQRVALGSRGCLAQRRGSGARRAARHRGRPRHRRRAARAARGRRAGAERRRRSSSSGRAAQTSSSGTSRRPAGEVLDEVEQRLLGPLHVVEHEHERPAARERLEQLADRPERLLARRRARPQAERAGEPLLDLAAVVLAASSAAQAWRAASSAASRPAIRAAADRFRDRPERDALAVGQAGRRRAPAPRAARTRELGQEAGLPVPAGATTVTSRRLRPSTARRHAATRRASSRARPTSGASSRRGTPGRPPRPRAARPARPRPCP